MTKNKKETLAQYLARDGVITICKPKKAPKVLESDKMHNKANGHRKAGSKTISERSIVMNACRGSV
jgi:hypothetical protein